MAQNTFKPNVAFVLIIACTCLALMFSTTSSSTPYQYLLFVQQWSKTVCANQCKAPSPVFTIHGLWPASYAGPQLSCTGAAFDPAQMNQHPVLKANLETKSWPDVIRGQHEGFWKHEWDTHGKCSDNVFPQTNISSDVMKCGAIWSYIVICFKRRPSSQEESIACLTSKKPSKLSWRK
ncbi:hypothetical protein M0R45_028571 [Rubus argutus]|uniref:Uncharacterized protein n=1 Tax=Rubus argutus TaxID=59490 RepID=A0AAW1W603_RUBAR